MELDMYVKRVRQVLLNCNVPSDNVEEYLEGMVEHEDDPTTMTNMFDRTADYLLYWGAIKV